MHDSPPKVSDPCTPTLLAKAQKQVVSMARAGSMRWNSGRDVVGLAEIFRISSAPACASASDCVGKNMS